MLPNFAASGQIGTAAATVDLVSQVVITQTTPSVSVTIPSPSFVAVGVSPQFTVVNAAMSSASIFVNGTTLVAGHYMTFVWDGAEWVTLITGAVDQLPAVNQWGQALAVTNGATATIASIASSVAGYQIKGFTANGIGDGYFFIQVASITILSGRIRSAAPVYVLTLPNGIAVATGSTVTLKVTNESGSTADFEATLLGM